MSQEILNFMRGAMAIALLLLGLGEPVRAETQYSMIMPLAPRSLLLDVVSIDDTLVSVGERGHILLSDDGGLNWRQSHVPTRQMLTAVYYASPERGWAVGHDGLVLNTVDGGENWIVQRDGLQQQLELNRDSLMDLQQEQASLELQLAAAADPQEHSELALLLEDLEMDIEDAQFRIDQPVNAPPLLDVYFSDALNGIAVGAFNTLLLSFDGGLNWEYMAERLENPDGYHLNSVTGDGRGGLWIAGEGGILYRSSDHGRSWESLTSPYPGSWFGISRAPGSGKLLVFGLRGKAYTSIDGGNNWTRVDLGTERSLAGGYFINDRYAVLVGAVGTVMMSSDGGETFTHRILENRLNLSAAACAGERIVVVGQGGVNFSAGFGADHE